MYSGNRGITNCTTATVTTVELRTAQQLQWQQLYTTFFRLSKKYIRNGTRHVSYILMQNIIYVQQFFWQTKMLDNKCVVKYVTEKQSQTLHKYQQNCYSKEHFALSFSNFECTQFNILYRMFTECINLCDVVENFSNTKEPTVNLLPELHYRSKYKLNIRESLWR